MNIYILDTNILIADPLFELTYLFSKMGDYKIIIIKSVLDELDSLKEIDGVTGFQAREASRGLETLLLNSQKFDDYWEISHGCYLVIDEQIEFKLPKKMHQKTCDDRLLASAAKYSTDFEENTFWLVSLDRNLRVRAEALNLNWINPASWFPINTNSFYIPFAALGLFWTQTGEYIVRLAMDLEKDKTSWVEVWPYWGYPSGQFSTLHIRLFDPEYEMEKSAKNASSLIILNTKNKINYQSKLRDIPYKIILPKNSQSYTVIHKKWKIVVSITRVQITDTISDQSEIRNNAMVNIGLGVSNISKSSFMSGMLIGTGINAISSIARNTPVFSRLGFSIQVSLATDEELEKHLQEQKSEYESKRTKKMQNTIVILIILAIIIGFPILVAACCILSSITASV